MKFLIKHFYSGCMILLMSCSARQNIQMLTDTQSTEKIEFDINSLNAQGLYGAVDGLKSLSYEFCIPAYANKVREIHQIDSEIKVYRHSPGRVSCQENEYLCIGETHHKPYRKILNSLAALPYIKRIIQSDFE